METPVTTNRSYPIPFPTNNVSDDVSRLIAAFQAIDADVAAIIVSLAGKALAAHGHAIADVSGLQTALNGKAASNHQHKLDDLTDVDGADAAATGLVLTKSSTGWVPQATQVPAHSHAIADVTGLAAALAGTNVFRALYEETVSGAAKDTFTIPGGYTTGAILVFQNGTLLDSSDFTATNGTTVVLAAPAPVGDSVRVVAFRIFNIADVYTQAQSDTRFARLDAGNTFGSSQTIETSGAFARWSLITGDGQRRAIRGARRVGGNVRARWEVIFGDEASETGSNVGSDFSIDRYNDGGDYFGTPLLIRRSSGLVEIGGSVSIGSETSGVAEINNGLGEAIRFDDATDTTSIRSGGSLRHQFNGTRFYSTTPIVVGFSGSVPNQDPALVTGVGFAVWPVGSINLTVADDFAASFRRNGSDGHVLRTYRGATLVGSVAVTASATAYNTSSDYRLKSDVEDLTGSGDFIDALRPRRFRWIATNEVQAGFIAHEFAEVSPSSVFGEKDGQEMQSMQASTSEVIANMVAELQSLRARVAALEGGA